MNDNSLNFMHCSAIIDKSDTWISTFVILFCVALNVKCASAWRSDVSDTGQTFHPPDKARDNQGLLLTYFFLMKNQKHKQTVYELICSSVIKRHQKENRK